MVCHRDVAEQLSDEHIQILCHRHYGVGSNGLLIDSGDQINPTLRIINPDDSEAKRSGNGLRTYTRHLFNIDHVGYGSSLAHTANGDIYHAVHGSVHQISVNMGRANFNSTALSALVNLPEAVGYPLPLADETLSVVLVSMGSPHYVVLIDKLDLVQVHCLGPQIENRFLSPKRTNVQFVEIIDRHTLKIDIWERGVGLMMASGSSSRVTVSAICRLGKVDGQVDVNVPGNQLHITFDANSQVCVRGPMHEIASLTLDKGCSVGDSVIFTGTA